MKSLLMLAAGSLLMAAPAAAAVDASEPGRFVQTLSDEAFAALRTGSRATARTRFRAILAQHVAIDVIGDRLIGRWRPKITPTQYQRYRAAFPAFIVGTYGDRLSPYADAKLKVVRVVPRGAGAAVMTTVTRPGGRPASAIWTVARIGGGYKVTNLTASGVNLGLAQQADFDSTIQRRGFDALLAFMASRA